MARRGEVVIRRLRPGDGNGLATLLSTAFAEEFAGAGTDAAAVQRQVRASSWAQTPGIRHLMALLGARFAYFVAVCRGRVVGSTAIGGGRLLTISSVAVLPEFRGLGIAHALMERAHRFALEHGRDRVVLDVLAHNTPALRLYERLGYEEYHRFHAYELPLPHIRGIAATPHAYWLEPVTPRRAAAFGAVERASLPARYFEVVPTLRDRYIRSGASRRLEGLLGGVRTHRRVLVHDGRTAGFLLTTVVAGQAEGRIDLPLVLPQATDGLTGALVDAVRFVEETGRYRLRLDISHDRSAQQATAEALGFHRRWTYVQMVRRLSTPLRIPVRVIGNRE
ncbi:MAG: GNAT family N-acetyltransferase [Dehalococcoidia bacterium]